MKRLESSRWTSPDVRPQSLTAKFACGWLATFNRNSWLVFSTASLVARRPTCTSELCTDARTITRSKHCSRRLRGRCGQRAGVTSRWLDYFRARRVCCDRDRGLQGGESYVGEEGV